jgi:hypothetical protein
MDGQNNESLCPTTGEPIVLDLAVLSWTAPIKFVCPACRQVHAFHAMDGKVTPLSNAYSEDSN